MRFSLFLVVLCTVVQSLWAQDISLAKVYDRYMSMKSLYMEFSSTQSSSNRLDTWTTSGYLYMNRIGKRQFDVVFADERMNQVYLKINTHPDSIQAIYQGSPKSEYYYFPRKSMCNCWQVIGVNLHTLLNPFSDCFYHKIRLLNTATLTDIGNSYYFSMESSLSHGFGKDIYINKSTLLVDSIKRTSLNLSDTSYYTIAYKYLSDGIMPVNPKRIDLVALFDSLSHIVKSKPAPKTRPIDTAAIEFNNLTLLDFWFIGCGPCIVGFPKIQELRDSFSPEFLNIVALTPRDDPNNISYFKVKHGYTFDMKPDSSNITDYYGVTQFPTLILIDSNGNELQRVVGVNQQEFEDLKSKILELSIEQGLR